MSIAFEHEHGTDGAFKCSYCAGWFDDVRVVVQFDEGEHVALQVCQECEDQLNKEM